MSSAAVVVSPSVKVHGTCNIKEAYQIVEEALLGK